MSKTYNEHQEPRATQRVKIIDGLKKREAKNDIREVLSNYRQEACRVPEQPAQ